MTYKTVICGHDWGPAIDKIILDLDQNVESKQVNLNSFLVWVKQTDKDNQELNHSQRTVVNAYTSDASGNETGNSRYITLELEIGPTLSNGSPFIYNRKTGRNEYIKSDYEIKLLPSLKLIDLSTGDLKPLCDLFVHNQTYNLEGVSLSYAYYKPTEPRKNKPLIIWLHGAGEGGLDTTIAVLGNKVTNLVTNEIQSFFGSAGAYVLVPQAPTMWMDFDGQSTYNLMVDDSDGFSFYGMALKGLIDAFVSAHPDIDVDRIYIGGCSNGGYMTVKMIIDYPDYFAAAFPTCAAYSSRWLTEDRIMRIKSFPIWLVHSQNDPVVRIAEVDDFSNALFSRLNDAGNPFVYYSLYDKVVDPSKTYYDAANQPFEYHGHWSWIYTLSNSCTQIINDKCVSLFEWLASQKR